MMRSPTTEHPDHHDQPDHPARRAIIVLVVGWGIALAVGALFAWWLQSTGDWRVGLPWERAILLAIDPSAPRVVDAVMLVLPWLGTNLTLAPIIAVAALWVWRKHGRADLALELVVVVLGSLLLNALLKDLFDRPRPDLWPRRGQYQWAAYPSGHAIVGISVFFTIAAILYRELRWRWPFVATGAFLIISLYSRLYLGVHWPTDVLGGLLIGGVWLAVVQLAFRPFHTRAHSRSADGAVRPNSRTLGRRSSIEGAGA